MTEELTRKRFAAGEVVPEWLLVAEPMYPNSVRGQFSFATPVDVIETDEYFVVLVLPYGPYSSALSFSGAGCKILAASKAVRIPGQQSIIQPESVDAWGSQIVVTPAEPRKGFWARVKAVFS